MCWPFLFRLVHKKKEFLSGVKDGTTNYCSNWLVVKTKESLQPKMGGVGVGGGAGFGLANRPKSGRSVSSFAQQPPVIVSTAIRNNKKKRPFFFFFFFFCSLLETRWHRTTGSWRFYGRHGILVFRFRFYRVDFIWLFKSQRQYGF